MIMKEDQVIQISITLNVAVVHFCHRNLIYGILILYLYFFFNIPKCCSVNFFQLKKKIVKVIHSIF